MLITDEYTKPTVTECSTHTPSLFDLNPAIIQTPITPAPGVSADYQGNGGETVGPDVITSADYQANDGATVGVSSSTDYQANAGESAVLGEEVESGEYFRYFDSL